MELLNFLLKSVLCSGILISYYWLCLRNRPIHQFNRSYLLLTVIASLLLPLLHVEWVVASAETSDNVVYQLLSVREASSAEEEILTDSASSMSLSDVLILLYLCVTATLTILMILRIWSVFRIKKESEIIKQEGYSLVLTSLDKAPFSFFKLLFWNDSIDIKTGNGQRILRHELAHIRQLHTLDKLFLQASTALFWLNPFLWLIQKELSMIHEFIADEEAVNDKDTETFALMLLQTHYGNAFRDVVHPFFQTPVKRRLVMIQQIKNLKHATLRKLLIVPALALATVLVSFEMKETSVVKAHNKLVLAVDAGHGVEDKGAKGVNGILEKELNLKVAATLEKLSKEYNIVVVTTRKGDDYPSLTERPAIAEQQGADIFLSIHINQSPDGDEAQELPYEMIVDERNNYYEESRLLASLIAPHLKQNDKQAVLSQKHLAVLGRAEMPAILLELGNIANAKQVAVINDEVQLEELCRNILTGIVAYQNRK